MVYQVNDNLGIGFGSEINALPLQPFFDLRVVFYYTVVDNGNILFCVRVRMGINI